MSYALNGILAKELIDEIIYSFNQPDKIGRVNRPYLGIEFYQSYTYTGMEWDAVEGILIKSLIPHSPAANSNLAQFVQNGNYYITHINNRYVKNIHSLLDELENCSPNKMIKISVAKNNFKNTSKDFHLSPTTLSGKNIQKITTHFLSNYQLRSIPHNGLLELEGNLEHEDINIRSGPSRPIVDIFTRGSSNNFYQVYAASPYESSFKYQLTNNFDFGVMIRLCSIEGRILLYAKKGNIEKVISIQVSSEDNGRSLFF